MKKKVTNINEEVGRIKSLFSDERLYGNLTEQTSISSNEGLLKKRNDGIKDYENFFKNYKYDQSDFGSPIPGGFISKSPQEVLDWHNENTLDVMGLPNLSWQSIRSGGFLPHNATKITNLSSFIGFSKIEELKGNSYGNVSCRYIFSKDMGDSWKGYGGPTGKPITINQFNIPTLERLSDGNYSLPDSLDGKGSWLSYWLIADFYFNRKDFSKKFKDTINWNHFLSSLYGTSDITQIEADLQIALSNSEKFDKERKCYTNSKQESGVGAVVQWLMENVTIHDILQIGAAILFLIPGGQPIAIFLEVLDSGIYFAEGDTTSGTLGLIFSVIPGFGPLFRRIGGNGIKKVNNVIKKADDVAKNTGSDEAVKKTIKAESKKLSEAEAETLALIMKNSDDVIKDIQRMSNMSKKDLKKELLERGIKMDEWVHGIGEKSKFQSDLDQSKIAYSTALGSGVLANQGEDEEESTINPMDNISKEKVIFKQRTDDSQTEEVKDGVRIIYLDTDEGNVNSYNEVLNTTTAPSGDDNQKALDYLKSM